MRVLVADDEPATLLQIRMLLNQAGFEVMTASSGTEALHLWLEHRPAIVLTDWDMPGMDGESLCRLIRQTPADHYTYVVIITGKTQQEPAVAGLEAGADDYVQKPFESRELVLRVQAGQRISELQTELANRVAELQDALARVRTLEGLLPTCCYCHRVRDENDEWHELEAFIRHNTLATFSHGYCPDCYATRVLPQLDKRQS